MIQGDGTPLPLVFRNSLNKQAPIKVPRYIVHLEVGTISHGASANHFPSHPPPPSSPQPLPPTPPPAIAIAIAIAIAAAAAASSLPDPSGRECSGCPELLLSTYPAPLKTICHRPRKYVLERNVRSTFFFFSFFFCPLLFLSRPRKYESARQTMMMVTADHPFPRFSLSLSLYPSLLITFYREGRREWVTIRFLFPELSAFRRSFDFRDAKSLADFSLIIRTNGRVFLVRGTTFFFVFARRALRGTRSTSEFLSEYEYDHYPNPVYVFASFHNQIKPGLIAGSLALYQNCWPIRVYRGNE